MGLAQWRPSAHPRGTAHPTLLPTNTTLAHRCARPCLVSTFSFPPKCVPEEGSGSGAALCLLPTLEIDLHARNIP
jgi:hypothetical protein